MTPGTAAMKRRYVTADVFTDRVFGGNPLAVVLDAEGLSTAQMQAMALEFNYSETTFVLPPVDPANTAKVRIFTPRTEVPFAGHPNVGTAFALARDGRCATAGASGGGGGGDGGGGGGGGIFIFEEAAGLVPLTPIIEGGAVVGAELRAPEALSRRSTVRPEVAAACLSLQLPDIAVQRHLPQIVSVGLPFLAVELASRDALRRSRPNIAVHAELLPLDGADAVFAYWRAHDAPASPAEIVLHARMFSPLDGIVEDPATGSACAAAIALLAALDSSAASELAWRIHQGADMGRPSLLLGRTVNRAGAAAQTYVGGRCVAVLEGSFVL